MAEIAAWDALQAGKCKSAACREVAVCAAPYEISPRSEA